MSVLIKGMEMPTSCRACPLATQFFDGEDVCAMLGTYVHDMDREDDCPLIPIPPHGRLIDADKLCELCGIMADNSDDIFKSIWNQFKTTVEWCPTIIPPEEE